MKTNAARLLNAMGIPYELRSYEADPEHVDAVSVAAKLGLPPEQVFKTLVVRGDRTGVALAVVPANAELDLKALARLSGDRRVEMVSLKEIQGLTGYVRGGVTALACRKPYPVYVDESITGQTRVSVSAGSRGMQLLVSTRDYVRAVGAKTGPILNSRPE